MSTQGQILWTPPADVRETTTMGRLLDWIEAKHGVTLAGYDDAWRWSVDDIGRFWSSLAEFLGVKFHTPTKSIVQGHMPDAQWFEGATLNFAEHTLDGPGEDVVITSYSEARDVVRLTRDDLRRQVAAVRTGLRRLGVQPGDRVALYLPNVSEAIIGVLAVASLGAVATSCPPEFGPRSVIDRFAQVKPKVLLAVNGYKFGGKRFDRSAELAEIRAAVPGIETTVWLPHLDGLEQPPDSITWDELRSEPGQLEFEAVPFQHPLYILYSSGTTGLPKGIVHSHGGIVLEHLKWHAIHDDIRPGDTHFWYSSTGWMAWNLTVSTLMSGASVVTLDGALDYPDPTAFWRLIAEERITHFCTSPGYLASCRSKGVVPNEVADLSAIRTMTCGGAPMPADLFEWVYRSINEHLYLSSGSGGTDVAGAFVGGCRLLPVRAGEIACRFLGCDVHAFDDDGHVVVGEQGELVVLQPMPSMPVGLWGDDDGSRIRSSYFSRYPGVWRHGDWVTFTEAGSAIVHGRSDATLNRGGVRIGSGEIYNVVNELAGVSDSLVVHLENDPRGTGQLLLFLVLENDVAFDEPFRENVSKTLRQALSPRHVPDRIFRVPAVPRTSTGKLMEVPVKRILQGADAGAVASIDSLADPDALRAFQELVAAGAIERPS